MLNCRELTDLVTDYVEGRLPLARRMEMALHLGMCRHCRAYLHQMKVTVRTLGSLPREPLPEPIRDELLARFRNMRRPERAAAMAHAARVPLVERWFGPRRGWGIAASLVALSGLLALFFSDGSYERCDTWSQCLLTELFAAAVPIVAALALSATFRVRLSSGTLAAFAAMGGFAGYLALTAACPSIHLLTHTLSVHAGGLVVVTALGAAAALIPTAPSVQSG